MKTVARAVGLPALAFATAIACGCADRADLPPSGNRVVNEGGSRAVHAPLPDPLPEPWSERRVLLVRAPRWNAPSRVADRVAALVVLPPGAWLSANDAKGLIVFQCEGAAELEDLAGLIDALDVPPLPPV